MNWTLKTCVENFPKEFAGLSLGKVNQTDANEFSLACMMSANGPEGMGARVLLAQIRLFYNKEKQVLSIETTCGTNLSADTDTWDGLNWVNVLNNSNERIGRTSLFAVEDSECMLVRSQASLMVDQDISMDNAVFFDRLVHMTAIQNLKEGIKIASMATIP